MSATSFAELGLRPELLRAVEEAGYTTPTPIQAQAIPHLLATKGNIVNVASVAAFKGQAYTAAYCASKGGVVQLTKGVVPRSRRIREPRRRRLPLPLNGRLLKKVQMQGTRKPDE